MSFFILNLSRGRYDLIETTDRTDPDAHRYIGEYRTRYEAEFEKFLLEHRGADAEELRVSRRAAEKAEMNRRLERGCRRRRSRFDRIRRNEDVV